MRVADAGEHLLGDRVDAQILVDDTPVARDERDAAFVLDRAGERALVSSPSITGILIERPDSVAGSTASTLTPAPCSTPAVMPSSASVVRPPLIVSLLPGLDGRDRAAVGFVVTART